MAWRAVISFCVVDSRAKLTYIRSANQLVKSSVTANSDRVQCFVAGPQFSLGMKEKAHHQAMAGHARSLPSSAESRRQAAAPCASDTDSPSLFARSSFAIKVARTSVLVFFTSTEFLPPVLCV